jgi:poly(3-hydroxybutyrate) depolymerase
MFINILSYFFLLQNTVFAVQLSKFNIDKTKITVSGISSGAAMANQLHVAHSKLFSGAGIVAGPPYYCARGSSITATTTCMSGLGIVSLPSIYTQVSSYASSGLIDPVSNLKDDKVYIYHGLLDVVVSAVPAKKNEDFYNNYMPASQIKTVYTMPSVHGFITNKYGFACNIINTWSYLNNCLYNQAYEILNYFYGNLNEPALLSSAAQSLIEIGQSEFFPSGTSSSIQMDSIGYLYVPKRCAENNLCKLHIALHGCGQGRYRIGNEFAKYNGYNEVADLNDVIILYPQATSSLLSNPNGCWDWWGFTSSNYATKSAPQIAAIKGMIDRITG